MDSRTKIPALALLGLSFTSCGGDEPNPIVGAWGAISLEDMKLPYSGPYNGGTIAQGFVLTIEDDLTGALDFYAEYDFSDYNAHYSYGTDLVVDDAAAPKYRIELAHDLLGEFVGDDEPPSESAGASAGYADDIGDGLPLALPPRPAPAPAALILHCNLTGDVLTCASEADAPIDIVFKRKPTSDDDG